MPLLKVQGIVLKQMNLGEADKIITLFTDKLGKIRTVVHGARKPKSRFMSSAQVFSYSEYILYKGKSLYTINQSELKESFQVVLSDIYCLTYSSYLMELTDVLTQEEENNIELFKLLLKTMYLMTSNEADKELIVRAFELKALAVSGYMPNLSRCSVCSGKGYGSVRFSISLGGVICAKCAVDRKQSIKIDAATLNVMRYLIRMDIEKIRTLKVSQTIRDEMKKILKNYIKYYLEKDFRSLEFLDELKNIESR